MASLRDKTNTGAAGHPWQSTIMRTIRINFIGGSWDRCAPIDCTIYRLLAEKFEVVITSDPDYLFVKESGCMYRSLRLRYPQSNCIRIFVSGEAIFPDFNLFDYAMGMDDVTFGDRYFRWLPFEYLQFHKAYGDIFRQQPFLHIPACKTRFCNFIYSNPHAHPMRDTFFHALDAYKTVDSLGRHMRNVPLISATISDARDWRDESIRLKQRYKFSLAFENALYRGYTSEKIITSFMARSIPIYWGNPAVGEIYNEHAFVNVHAFPSVQAAIERIREIDEDEGLWCTMANQPAIHASGSTAFANYLDELRRFLYHIFEQPLQSAKRRGMGTHCATYERQILRSSKASFWGWLALMLSTYARNGRWRESLARRMRTRWTHRPGVGIK